MPPIITILITIITTNIYFVKILTVLFNRAHKILQLKFYTKTLKLYNIYNNDHNQNTYQGSNASLEETKKINEDNSDLLKDMATLIGDISEVRFTKKLKKHPVCLTSKGDISIEMQKVFDAMPNDLGLKADTVLEINEAHPISDKLKKLYKKDKDEFNKYTKILYCEARMIAGLPIDNPTEISSLICEVIAK